MQYYCPQCTAERREERLLRERDDPMTNEIKYERQIRKLYG